LPGEGGVSIQLYTSGHYIQGYSDHQYGPASGYDKASGLLVMKESNHVSIWVQKTRVRVYLHGQKVFDIPKAFSPGMLLNQFRIMPDHASAPMITNMRFAEAGADMRSKLITEGKLVTRGILFDVNSDKIKPESYGVLKEISKALSENPDVKVRIIGHTDSDGTDEANLDLSKRRAASVKNALNSEFGIDLSRMETDGKGESEPFDQNNNPEGKANNRRVEFIKL
jgi:outer membrane protein OmpA-like peptidoglycan-associated protein